jgi:hypothetical protein
MDTRAKILSMDAVSDALRTGEWRALVGLFDPLTVTQARRFADLSRDGRKLLGIVLDTDGTLLPANARAALIAGLREFDAVVIAAPGLWRALIPQGAHVQIVEDEAGERARSAEFVQFLLRRQNA